MSDSTLETLQKQGEAARSASRQLATISTEAKNQALINVAANLKARESDILSANEEDYVAGAEFGLSTALLDRLMLNSQRIDSLAQDVKRIAGLADPVGETFDMTTMPNGLNVSKRRVPLGVIGAIYESRPNVTIELSSICLKAGNTVILRGGKEALNSNTVLAELLQDSLETAGISKDAVQFIKSTDRSLVSHMLSMRETIDLLIPRGSASLIQYVSKEAKMPVVAGGIGVCHAYVDRSADPQKAVSIAYNAKVRRPSVCNALDTLLVHSEVASTVLPDLAQELAAAGVELRCDERSLDIVSGVEGLQAIPSTDSDWGREFLSLTASVRIVDSLDEAVQHIERYGSGHSEAIVTEDYAASTQFLQQVDASAVFVNASTGFNDGGELGLGAEVGISTQKFHARGPMGLREMTSYKWVILGTGQIRP